MGKTKYLAAMGLGLFTICLVTRIKGECPPTGCEADPDYCECPEECCEACPNYCPCPSGCPCQPTDFSCCGTGDCLGDRWCPVAPLAGAGSDLTISDIANYCAWGSSGSGSSSIAAFSAGNVNCNSGTRVLHWDVPGTNKRPVLGQNMYRLTEDDANKDHRFEQIGMAEVKWAFS